MKAASEEGLLLSERAYGRLKEELLSGRLKASQYVSMQDLVGLLDSPLAPTREAVKRAAGESLLRIVPKRGVYVMDVTPELIRQCFELRSLLDQEGARTLAVSTDPAIREELAALEAAHRRVRDEARGGVTAKLQQEAKEVDWRLHQSLVGALGNPLVEEIYERNRERILVMQNTRPLLPDRIVPAMDEHLAILEAIGQGDPEAAARAVREHFRQTLRWWGIL